VIAFMPTTLDYRFFSFVPAVAWLLFGLARRGVDASGGRG
jgi:hypothetical protein